MLYGKRRSHAASFISFLLFFFVIAFFSQFFAKVSPVLAVEPDIRRESAGFASVLYNNTNGLPTSEASCMVQSEDGFLWIGGYSGLMRYDGNEFYRYDSTSGVANVTCLFVDSEQRLWIGTNDNGVAVLEQECFTFYKCSDGISSSIRAIEEDRDGNILAATTIGLGYIEDGELKAVDDLRVRHKYICKLISDGNDLVYGITREGDYFTVENCRIKDYYSCQEHGFELMKTIYPDPINEGMVYLGNWESTVYHGYLADEKSKFTEISVAPQSTVNFIRRIDGRTWVCAENGIGYFDDSGHYVQIPDIPMNNSVDTVMQDYEGNLWFTSSRQGVMKIVPNRFTDIFKILDVESLVVNSVCKTDGLIYFATDNGLFAYDADNNRVDNAATSLLSSSRVRCAKQDSKGFLWLCSYNNYGLVRYDPVQDELKCFTTAEGLVSDRVRMTTELSDGRIAVATNGGCSVISGDEVIATYDESCGISNPEILCIEETSDGKLLLGSDGGGIYVIDGDRVSQIGLSDDGLQSEVVMRIKKDPDEELFWLITSNSIAYLKDGQVTTIRKFPYSNNLDLYFDDVGKVWVLSSNGIYVVKKSDLIKDEDIPYILYDTKCGLPGIATANSYSWLDKDGTLYIAMSTGVCSVNINASTEADENVKLAIPFIMADEQYVTIDQNGTVHIPSSCRRINIYANALTNSLTNPRLSYMLEGFDEEPVCLNKRDMTYASYTNLPGGTYTFSISLMNTFSGEVEKTVSVTIEKEKSLSEQMWFQLLLLAGVLVVIVLVTFLFFHRKTVNLVKKQQENRKLINEMTKVFANCIDMKDTYTNGHSTRVAKYTAMLAERLGKSKTEVEDIYNIALLHDIGKISIPDCILNKPGELTADEYEVMKNHPQKGYDILKDITISPGIALGAGYHHEKYDGTGYPSGLGGNEIPEVAQIIAVADTFDAMYSTRPYRKQMPLEQVAAEIKRCSGTQFNPKVVDAFLQLVEEGAFDQNEAEPGDRGEDTK